MCSNNFCQIFFPYIKMSNNSWSKCCQNNKKRLQKRYFDDDKVKDTKSIKIWKTEACPV